MLFDSSRELPAAHVVIEPRTLGELVRGGLAAWFTERWSWLRPRTIPVSFAFVGFLGLVQAWDYLTHMPTPEARTSQASSRAAGASGPSYSPTRMRIVVGQ